MIYNTGHSEPSRRRRCGHYRQAGRHPSQQPKQPASFDWQDGDIAFLKGVGEFTRDEYDALIKPGYLQEGATKHPVIILEHSEDSRHFLVTTVSAYGSGDHNDYLPPWKQPYHARKSPRAFRAFYGSVRPDSNKNYLQLEEGGSFPKPKTSWVYANHTFVVPLSTLKGFDRTTKRLRMTKESLKDLIDDMKRNRNFASRWTNPRVLQILGSSGSETASSPPRHTDPDDTKAATPATLASGGPSRPSSSDPRPGAPKQLWNVVVKINPATPYAATSWRAVAKN